jgi:NitT/TauT family transport system ATP-binding protein
MSITLRGITKKFPIKQSASLLPVLDGIDLQVSDGSVVALFGPNGCGKTTILKIVAGIEPADSGDVDVKAETTDKPLIGYAFQNFHEVLLPWLSATENVAFGLRALGVSRREAIETSKCFLDNYNLMFPRDNYSYQLSIGQQQTVALARTLIQSPSNLLLDEPFAALDHEARYRMQDAVLSVSNKLNSTILVISHDIDEAMYMSDELLLLSKRPARIIQRFTIPFSRPRRHDLLTTVDFALLRREILSVFLEEVGT